MKRKATPCQEPFVGEAQSVMPFITPTPPNEGGALLNFNLRGLREGIQYKYTNDGFVDWLEMVDKSEIVPFKENFIKRKMEAPSSIEGLDYKDCLILLMGFKKLARLRGYTSIRFNTEHSSLEYVDVECVINWLPNYETGGYSVISSGKGDASIHSCDSFTKYYLSAMAENRAFVRAVKNFLNIPVYGKDEIGVTPEDVGRKNGDVKSSPHTLLGEIMLKKNISLERLKEKLVKEKIGDPSSYNSLSDIPLNIVLDIVGKIAAKSN
jgi:hypothetical protein